MIDQYRYIVTLMYKLAHIGILRRKRRGIQPQRDLKKPTLYKNRYDEVPEYISTGEELLQLVRYWADVIIDYDHFVFLYQQISSHDSGLKLYVSHRINRIAELLGREEVYKAIDNAYERYGKDCDPSVPFG